jgi:DNA end-binding protein Ku
MASTIWKGHLTFGLVSIPIRLSRAARAEKVQMHHLQRNTGARVRQVFVPADEPPAVAQPSAPFQEAAAKTGPSPLAATTQAIKNTSLPSESQHSDQPADRPPSGQGISRSDLVRGFEYEKGKYVEFEPGELENIAPKSSDDMQIVQFVHFEEVDPVYLETSYYVAPDGAGEKAYALLFEALKTTGFAAIAEFVMHRRDQTMILRAASEGIIAHTLFHEDEVRRENEFHVDSSLVAPKEMDLAVKLVEALAAKFEPEKFRDKYREKLQAAIAAKVETGAVRKVVMPAESPAVVDIMAALTESLARVRKPVASEGKAARASGMEKKKGVGRKDRA